MICGKCGRQFPDGNRFCPYCGTRVDVSKTQYQPGQQGYTYNQGTAQNANAQAWNANGTASSRNANGANPAGQNAASQEKDGNETHWFKNLSLSKKILVVIAAVVVAVVAFLFLREYWPIVFGLLFVAALFFSLFIGSREERLEAKKLVIKLVFGFVVIVVAIALYFHIDETDPNLIPNLVQPGYSVRNAYFTEFSDEVTIEEAFNNYFTSPKWSAYKGDDGYDYVVFNGTCSYEGLESDVRITFQLTGEHFNVDHMDVNGSTVSEIWEVLLLTSVYEDYIE